MSKKLWPALLTAAFTSSTLAADTGLAARSAGSYVDRFKIATCGKSVSFGASDPISEAFKIISDRIKSGQHCLLYKTGNFIQVVGTIDDTQWTNSGSEADRSKQIGRCVVSGSNEDNREASLKRIVSFGLINLPVQYQLSCFSVDSNGNWQESGREVNQFFSYSPK
ncbi:MAG TPA: hypothetical protein PLE43_04410 [Alphaproteobacteria bacterium]|nr:hypothetical protein [Alphaproteobacteria bacterium]